MKFHRIHPRPFLLGALFCAFLMTGGKASAGSTYYWHLVSSPIDNDWGKAGNWYNSGSNYGGDQYIINNGEAATISSSVSCVADFVAIQKGTLNVQGGSLTTALYENFGIGGEYSGTLNLNSGSISVYNSTVGSGGGGALSVTGGTFGITSTLVIGYVQSGSLSMSGGLVTADTASIGYDSGNGMPLGYGSATLTGGTLAVTNTLGIGQGGGGNLNLNGGTVTAGYAQIGALGTGTANITSGTFTIANTLSIGVTGTGNFSLSGGTVTARYADIGSGGLSTVTLTGGTFSIAKTITIAGSSGTGTLNVGNGGAAGTLTATKIQGGGGTAVLNFNHTDNVTTAAVLSGNLVVNKLASGTTTLTGTNTYTGSTNITGGKLIIEGSISASSMTTVTNSALGGSGTVGALTIANGGTVTPGSGAGKITAGNTTFQTGGTLQLDLTKNANGTAGTDYDQLSILGNLDLTNVSAQGFKLKLQPPTGDSGTFDPGVSHVWTSIVTVTGAIVGFASDKFTIDLNGFYTGVLDGSFSVIQNNNTLSLQYVVVPEPNLWSMLAGAGGVFWIFRKKLRRIS